MDRMDRIAIALEKMLQSPSDILRALRCIDSFLLAEGELPDPDSAEDLTEEIYARSGILVALPNLREVIRAVEQPARVT